MDLSDQKAAEFEPVKVIVTDEVLKAGKALIECIYSCDRAESKRHFNAAKPALARKEADVALAQFGMAVISANPHLDYTKILFESTSDFDHKHNNIRIRSVEPVNQILTELASELGYRNPERFAVFSKKNRHFQL